MEGSGIAMLCAALAGVSGIKAAGTAEMAFKMSRRFKEFRASGVFLVLIVTSRKLETRYARVAPARHRLAQAARETTGLTS